MKVVVITPPAPIVTIDEAKKHLLVDHSDDDTLIEALILAATQWLDGPAGWLSRSLGIQVLELQGSIWPCPGDTLPYPPEVEIVSVQYTDPSGVEHDLPPPWDTEDRPAVRGRPGDVRIRYRAGYGSASGNPVVWTNNVPAPIKVAILMLVAQWYRTREPIAVGATIEQLPFAVEALLSPYRVYR
jgi:uncharacterized phiE125 gp8 family phage protein